MPTGQWNPRGVPWLPSGDALHHLCPPASLYSVHVKPFNPHTHTPTHPHTHAHTHPICRAVFQLSPSPGTSDLPTPWFHCLPRGIFQTVPSRDNHLFFSVFFPKDGGPSLSFPHQHISCNSSLHLLSVFGSLNSFSFLKILFNWG